MIEKLERYHQQDVTHATGHIILGNRFNLKYVGTGEGSQYFGHGIYLEESPEVAEHYRMYGIPNFGKGTIHVHTDDGMTYSASDKDSWDNSPNTALREALNLVSSSAIINPAFFDEQSFDEIKAAHLKSLNQIIALYKQNNPSATNEIRKIEQKIQALQSITGFEFSPDENSNKRGNIYRVRIPDNDVLLQWHALLPEQPDHVKKAISKIENVIYDMVNEYELDMDDFKKAKTGEDLYWAISRIMEQYLENNSPEDGITNPDERTSLLFNRFGVLGQRYWDNFSRDEMSEKFKEYQAAHPVVNDGRAFSIITTANGEQYTSNSTAWLASWSNNPNELLREVLNEVQRTFDSRRRSSLQEVKSELLDGYRRRIDSNLREIEQPQPKDYFVDKDQLRAENSKLKTKIDFLNSIVSFEYHPEEKPKNAFSLFGEEGTHNFVIWNEDAMKVLGLTEDSDQDAIDYFNKYKEEHPDGFIAPEAIEKFNQWVTHATGNIILGNRFDLRYVGSSEGSSAFGYGAYFEQARAVAETYRRFGLSADATSFYMNDGRILSTGSTEIGRDNISAFLSIEYSFEYYRRKYRNASWDEIRKYINEDIQNKLLDAKSRSDTFAIENYIKAIEILRQIKELKYNPNKRGNIYNFEIPEDYELLDWDENLDRQSKEITPILMQIVDTINNNPAEIIAFGFAQGTKRPKIVQERLTRVISSLAKKYKGHFIDSYEFRAMPEYKRLKSILHDVNTVDDLRCAINSITTSNRAQKIDTQSATGETLYWALVDLTGSKMNASMYLNSKGIPGHRFWDKGSRDAKTGTHNFVIWNMDKVRMIGIDPTSDQEAKDYYDQHRDRQLELFDGNSEQYSQFIGARGARKYGFNHDDYSILDAMKNAENMEREGISPGMIWRATGWMRGKEGKWRYEIPDGQLRQDFINRTDYKDLRLLDVYDNYYLYEVYPDLRSWKVEVKKLDDDITAYLNYSKCT